VTSLEESHLSDDDDDNNKINNNNINNKLNSDSSTAQRPITKSGLAHIRRRNQTRDK
jgi:hypothetical protein